MAEINGFGANYNKKINVNPLVQNSANNVDIKSIAESAVNLNEIKLPTPETEEKLDASMLQLAAQNKIKVNLGNLNFVAKKHENQEDIPLKENQSVDDQITNSLCSETGKKGFWSNLWSNIKEGLKTGCDFIVDLRDKYPITRLIPFSSTVFRIANGISNLLN